MLILKLGFMVYRVLMQVICLYEIRTSNNSDNYTIKIWWQSHGNYNNGLGNNKTHVKDPIFHMYWEESGKQEGHRFY